MPVEIKFDFTALGRAAKDLGAAADQIPFIMSLTLNRAVKDTREYLAGQTWPTSIVQRNPSFIRAALHMNFSSKTNLQVEIFDQLGRGSLKEHAEGGVKVPKGAQLAVPSRNIRRGPHGAPKSQKPRNLTNAFKKNDRIYQVTGKGKSRRINVMYFLKGSVPIPKQVPFYKDFGDQMRANISKELPKAVMQAMATRR